MPALLNALWRDESGQDLTEYVLLIVIIALGVTAAIIVLRDQISAVFNNAATALQNN
ncbi:MAG: Flp family type IVb pilin [Gemmatimonadota bacterium]